MIDKKYLLLFLLTLIFIVGIFSFSVFFDSSKPSQNTTDIFPSPSTTQNNSMGLIPIKTSIKNGETNVPLDSPISLDFNFLVNPSDFAVSLLPATDVKISAQGKSLIITPTSPLEPSTHYSLVVSTADRKKFITSLIFTSFGPVPTFKPDTRPLGEPERTDAELRRTRPDIFLANHTPYQEETFSITYTFQPTPTERFTFTVLLKAEENISKSNFLSWLKFLGLTETQISKIEISYN